MSRQPIANLVLAALLGALLAAPAQAAVIQRTITIDGVFGDWDPAPAADPCPAGNITCNPGQ
ncbi:MAG TPA: hypothetical protein VLA56_22230, partial [Pseudomonadales bacterium]|nr:hypothetical protein [Pseudomonadales bacterium]